MRAMFRSHFWQLRCLQKLPFLARKFCCFWQLYAMPDFFPILAIHKIAKIGKTCLLKVAKNGNFGCYYRFAIIGNICSSSKSSQMTTALPYIPSGRIGKDSLHTGPFLATLCLVTFCQFWCKVFSCWSAFMLFGPQTVRQDCTAFMPFSCFQTIWPGF